MVASTETIAPPGRFWLVLLLLAVLVGAVGRILSSGAEFWLDEILSWDLARQAGSPWGVLGLRHDNNHVLNTLWLTLCPDAAEVWVYRLHSLAAGLGAIVVAAWVASYWGREEAVFAAFLVAGNFWLALVSAEARGYALAVVAALAAFGCLRLYLDRRRLSALLLFWSFSCLGFLAHLTFVYPYLGFVVWSLRRFAREQPGNEFRQLLRCHVGVGLFCGVFYLTTVRGMYIAGAPEGPILPVVARLIVLGLGGPKSAAWSSVYLLVAGGLFVTGLRLLAKRGEDVWVFFAVTVAAAPALYLLRRPPFLFERYLLLSFVFLLLLIAGVFGALWRRGRAERLAVLGLLVVYLVGSAVHLRAYVLGGRGQFGEALAWVLEQDPSDLVIVTGDSDFRVGKYLEFYGRRHPDRELQVVSNREAERAGWVFVHRLEDRQPVEEEVRDGAGNRFRLVRAYPPHGPAAWGWYVYRRVR